MGMHATPGGHRGVLLRDVPCRIGNESKGMPAGHHGGAEIDTIGFADRHGLAFAIARDARADDLLPVDQLGEILFGLAARRPAVGADLRRIRRIDAMHVVSRTVELDGVAVDDVLGSGGPAQDKGASGGDSKGEPAA